MSVHPKKQCVVNKWNIWLNYSHPDATVCVCKSFFSMMWWLVLIQLDNHGLYLNVFLSLPYSLSIIPVFSYVFRHVCIVPYWPLSCMTTTTEQIEAYTSTSGTLGAWGVVWYLCNEVFFSDTCKEISRYVHKWKVCVCVCVCVSRGQLFLFLFLSIFTVPDSLELSCLVWTMGGNERTRRQLGSPKALPSFQTCWALYETRNFVFARLFLLYYTSRNLVQTGNLVGWYSLWVDFTKNVLCQCQISFRLLSPVWWTTLPPLSK